MSNARNLANLLGTGSTIATAKIADDAITSAKIADDAVVAAAIATDAVASDALNIVAADLPVNAVAKADILVGQNPGTRVSITSSTFQSVFTLTYNVVSDANKVLILSNLCLYGDVDSDSHETTSGQIRMQTSSDGGTNYTNSYTSNTSIIDRGGHSRYKTVAVAFEMDIPSGATSITIRWQGRRSSGNRTFNFGGEAGSQVTVIEVRK